MTHLLIVFLIICVIIAGVAVGLTLAFKDTTNE